MDPNEPYIEAALTYSRAYLDAIVHSASSANVGLSIVLLPTKAALRSGGPPPRCPSLEARRDMQRLVCPTHVSLRFRRRAG